MDDPVPQVRVVLQSIGGVDAGLLIEISDTKADTYVGEGIGNSR